ncbi:MAG: M48 family metallopeptidase [Zoogloeaceae bacterium]|jgi:STE24 endopeptidase|nr:M48 family metallopeptidase [Zoogloeaceae bacterium]
MSAHFFAVTTAVVLLSGFWLRLWLDVRQTRHVAARRGAVPESFARRVPLAAHQKAADYVCARIGLDRVCLTLDTLFFIALTWCGGLAAIYAFWDARFSGLLLEMAFLVSVIGLNAAIDLPLEIYATFRLEAHFGFNRSTPRLFFTDMLRNLFLFCLFGLPLMALALWLMRAAGSLWWFYLWLVWVSFSLAMLIAYPLWIAPWFNRFDPLPSGEARDRIENLLARGHFAGRDVYVMDGSRRSGHGNAYFAGFGKSRRIVFFDTLIARLTPGEIEAVLAHELGHFHHRHIPKRMAFILLGGLLVLAALDALLRAPWFFEGLGLPAAQTGSSAIALVLFALTLPLYAFFLTPLFSYFSRRDEAEADAYAARLSSASDLASALVRLYEDNAATLTPDPLHSRFYDSHPPAAERVERLLTLAALRAPESDT